MTPLLLTERDQRQLAGCMRTLLSPLDYPDLDGWRRAVNRSMRTLLGADMATFDMPGAAPRLLSEEHPAEHLNAYRPIIGPFAARYRIFERLRALKATNRERLWRGHLEAYYRSAYYHEFIVPTRCYDGLFAHTTAPGGEEATLYFHHERPDGRTFGERGLKLIRMLYPAFRSGVASWLALGRWHDSLARSVDRLSDAVALYSRAGTPLHRNPPMRTLLIEATRAKALEARLAEAARSAGATAQAQAMEPSILGPTGAPTRDLVIGSVPYRLTTTLVGSEHPRGGLVLVTIATRGSRLPAPRALRVRFGLTPRQTEVALLLARRKTNAEVATALGISPHTARRHTEKVLLKLGVESRRDVRGAISARGEDEA